MSCFWRIKIVCFTSFSLWEMIPKNFRKRSKSQELRKQCLRVWEGKNKAKSPLVSKNIRMWTRSNGISLEFLLKVGFHSTGNLITLLSKALASMSTLSENNISTIFLDLRLMLVISWMMVILVRLSFRERHMTGLGVLCVILAISTSLKGSSSPVRNGAFIFFLENWGLLAEKDHITD